MDEEILPYITHIYDLCEQALEHNVQTRNRKFESHGFLLGFLTNFSHCYTIDIDLELSNRNSYVTFLLRDKNVSIETEMFLLLFTLIQEEDQEVKLLD